jgi:TRAP-type C4-dicarboxylate transport system permease small subunit
VRRALDALYDGAAALAAACMVGLLGFVLLSIAGRQLHFHLPGTDAYAGYMMAAVGFLALAHTLKRGEHIRVTLLLSALQGRRRRAMELWALGMACLLANDATPLWIPQLAMAVGTIVLAIAFIDEWVLEWRGLRSQATSDEALHNE